MPGWSNCIQQWRQSFGIQKEVSFSGLYGSRHTDSDSASCRSSQKGFQLGESLVSTGLNCGLGFMVF